MWHVEEYMDAKKGWTTVYSTGSEADATGAYHVARKHNPSRVFRLMFVARLSTDERE